MLLRPRSTLKLYSPFSPKYVNYPKIIELWKGNFEPDFGKLSEVVMNRAVKKEQECLKRYRLNVDDDQTQPKSSANADQNFIHLLTNRLLFRTQASLPIAALRPLGIPKKIRRPLMVEPLPDPGTRFVLYSALFIEQKSGILYAADYPEECRLNDNRFYLQFSHSHPGAQHRMALQSLAALQDLLRQTGNWYPYARIFGEYVTAGVKTPVMSPILISISAPRLPSGRDVIDPKEIEYLQSMLTELSADRAKTIQDYDALRAKWNSVSSEQSQIVGDNEDKHNALETGGSLTEEQKSQQLGELRRKCSSTIRKNREFDENLADNYIGYQLGLTFLANYWGNVLNKDLRYVLRQQLDGKMSLPSTWMKDSEVFKDLDPLREFRFNPKALAAYGTFLPQPPVVHQASPNQSEGVGVDQPNSSALRASSSQRQVPPGPDRDVQRKYSRLEQILAPVRQEAVGSDPGQDRVEQPAPEVDQAPSAVDQPPERRRLTLPRRVP
jgi:hypothetical protein